MKRGRIGAAAGALLAAWLIAGPGCTPEGGGASVSASGEEDPRYRVALDLRARAGSAVPLHVVVEPRQGWHLAPEAPASLRLQAAGGVRVEPETQTGEAALRLSDAVLEFACQVGEAPAGDLHLTGRLKFGICEGDDELCAIVRRDLDLTLHMPGP